MNSSSTINASKAAPALLGALLVVGAVPVQAASEPEKETATLETVQVLGSEEEGFNVAVTEDMIDRQQVSDLEDLLSHEPSITVGGSLPVAQKIYVRGLEDTLLNVTIDGAAQAGYLYHHQGRVNVEPELIKEVVVKPGAGNATDGAGALGGAIHFVLKDAKDMLKPGQEMGALVKAGYFSNNGGLKSHASAYGLLTEDFGILANFTQLDADDNYEDGKGDEVKNSKLEQQDVRLKLSGDVAVGHYLSLAYEDYADDGVRFARPNMIDFGRHRAYPSPAVPQETHRESAIVNYGFDPQGDLIDLDATLYRNDSTIAKQGDLFAATWPPAGPPPSWTFRDYHNGKEHGGGVESIGLDVRNTSLLGSTELVYGIERREDEGYLINPAVTSFKPEDVAINAVYVQAEVPMNDVVNVSTGLRYDNYDYTDNHGETFQSDGFSPNMTVSVDVTPEFVLHAGIATAFKGVSIPEVWFLEFPPANSTLTNYQGEDDDGLGKVRAEESINKEVGFKYEAGAFAASGELYRQTIENAQNTGTTTRYSYLDDVTVDGYALRAAWFLDALELNAGVAQSKPELNKQPLMSGDMGLGTAYGRTWTTGVEYAVQETWALGWNARYVEELKRVREGQNTKAGYGIHDIYAEWTPIESVNVGLAVNNVLDKFYFDQGTFYTRDDATVPYGLPEPGRDFRVSLSWQY